MKPSGSVIGMDNPLTINSLIYGVISGGVFATFAHFLSDYFLKKADYRREREVQRAAAQLQEAKDLREEAASLRQTYQTIIDSLQVRIKASEDDRERLWKSFREMQSYYETIHVEDQKKIRMLEQQNESYAARIKVLEQRIPNFRSAEDTV